MKNWFYFIVGVIAIFSTVTHTIEGLATELPALGRSNLEYMSQAIFAFNYHIVAADHIGIGVALIIMSFQKNMAITRSAAWVVIIINSARVFVSIITVFTTLNASGNVGTFWIPTVGNILCIILILLGTRVKDKA